MSLPYHKVDWELVYEVRRMQGRVQELEKQVKELHRLVSTQGATGGDSGVPDRKITIYKDEAG